MGSSSRITPKICTGGKDVSHVFKPPFMSEGDALLHGVNWVKAVAEKSDEMPVNPMNIQKGTIIDRLYRSDQFPSTMALVFSEHD